MATHDDAASFQAPAEAYDRHIGRYGPALARELIEFAGIGPGMRCLDVGCGPGALSVELAAVVGAASVVAVDQSVPFAKECARRLPEAEVHVASAEELPLADGSVNAVLSQLVVNFLGDPATALAEMARVAVPAATVAACVWDYGDGMTLLRRFWDAAAALDPEAAELDEGRRMALSTAPALAELWSGGGLDGVETGELTVAADYQDFDDLWDGVTGGVGPAGAYCASLGPEAQKALRDELFRRLGEPSGAFELSARAWAVRGVTAAG
jgi:SAM-dependent methyltransferase